MNLFNRLPGFTPSPAGRERAVLRWLPKAALLGSLLLATPAGLARLLFDADHSQAITTTDIYVISALILHWTVLLTVGIAAFIILLMKGPAYVADAYPLHDKD